ncbi:hypothetical protein F966_00055 [Acinetobacter higginsii]|uniref:VWFA domain-containing protein n=1 Tax=Acinetobacter higginsii TaxID=70347 RepID=N8XWS7_9GAMM|nr:VWA domain-containing protein [Acinetobacter higginsii]ENV11500.1 hypothetical protein F966_00055 [Acinetobacter higginsii]
MKYSILSVLVGSLLLVGCGGGGGSDTNQNTSDLKCSNTQYIEGQGCKDKSLQSILDFNLPDLIIGKKVTLNAKSNLGLKVTYNNQTPKVCSISGNILTPLKEGTCTVQAVQNGNEKILAALPLTLSKKVGEANLPVTAFRNDKSTILSPISAIIENEFYFIGSDGTFINPQPSDFKLEAINWTIPNSNRIVQQNFIVKTIDCSSTTETFAKGAYSAMMLFDRSGSMNSNDPNDETLTAGRVFVDVMQANDQAMVSAFPKSTINNRPNEFNLYGNFSSDKNNIKQAINSVGKPDGNTPLYASIISSIDYTSKNGSNINKAVLAFTDGIASDKEKINIAISNSNRLGVPIFPIGLKDGDSSELSRIARETKGSFFYAIDVKQLSTIYKSLSEILRGNGRSCKVTLQTDLSDNRAEFTQSTNKIWSLTRSVNIDGVSVPIVWRQNFDVVAL